MVYAVLCFSFSITLEAGTLLFTSSSFSPLVMGRTRRCTAWKTPLSEHTFGKAGKSCSRPEHITDVPVLEEDTALPSQSIPLEDEPNQS